MNLILCFTLAFLCGCNPLDVLCFDDPDCPRQYFYCPIEHKKVVVHRQNVSTTCDGKIFLCPEFLTDRNCQMCATTYKDDQGHIWSTKPFKEIIQ